MPDALAHVWSRGAVVKRPELCLLPVSIWFAWPGNWIWAPAIGTIIGLVLVYPTGRLLTATAEAPRWITGTRG